MNVEQFLRQNTKVLEAAGIGNARLDVLVLLEDCLNTNRTQLLAHTEQTITDEQLKWLRPRIDRRAKHEPLAYIRGKTEFYGREFIINKNVLEPRPESETMIDMIKNILHNELPISKNRPWKITSKIIDVGTGSGALAITAKLEAPKATVIGIDIDSMCIEVAKVNSEKYNTDIEFKVGDLLLPLHSSSFIHHSAILANLPYVPDDYKINQAAGAEPKIAIFGGKDGLDIYRKLFLQLKVQKLRPRYILTESMPPQHESLANVAKLSGYHLSKTDDFIQQFTRV